MKETQKSNVWQNSTARKSEEMKVLIEDKPVAGGQGNIWRKGAACFPEKTELAGGEVIFTEKEQLYYLINGVLDGSYQVKLRHFAQNLQEYMI